MVYSYDGTNWSFFDNNALTPAPPRPRRPAESDVVQFLEQHAVHAELGVCCLCPPLLLQQERCPLASRTGLALGSTRTASGNASLEIIGQSPTGTDDLGRAVPALNMYAYRITNPATDSPTVAKRKLMISSSLHAGETLMLTYVSFVNWLISDDPRAARLRNVAEVLCYPELNPAGRYAGNSRTTVRDVNVDPNGLWDSTRWSNNSSVGCSGTTNCQDIRVSGTAMNTDVQATPGFLDAFVDFHSTVPDYTIDTGSDPNHQGWGRPDDFTYVNSDDVNRDWFVICAAQQICSPISRPAGGLHNDRLRAADS